MKKVLPAAIAIIVTAVSAYAAKLAAGEVKKNGGMKPTLDKARQGAADMFETAKQHPAVTKAAGAVVAMRDGLTGKDDGFTGGLAEDTVVRQPIAPSVEERSLMLAGDSAAKPETAVAAQAA